MRLFILLFLFLTSAFHLQAETVRPRLLFGIGFPPSAQLATANDSYSIYTNMAGTAFINKWQAGAGYQYQWLNPFNKNKSNLHFSQGILAWNFSDWLTLSAAGTLRLLQQPSTTDKGDIMGLFSLAVRLNPTTSLGVSLLKQRHLIDSTGLDFVWEAGFQTHPLWWFSIGGKLTQVSSNYLAPFSSQLGFTFKPGTKDVLIGFDNILWPQSEQWKDGYFWDSRLSVIYNFLGMGLNASIMLPDLAHGFKAPTLMAGFTVNFDNFSITPVAGGRAQDDAYAGVRMRLGATSFPSVLKKADLPKN